MVVSRAFPCHVERISAKYLQLFRPGKFVVADEEFVHGPQFVAGRVAAGPDVFVGDDVEPGKEFPHFRGLVQGYQEFAPNCLE